MTAARLLGAQVMLTGIQPANAQTRLQLGADLGGIATFSTIEEASARVLRFSELGTNDTFAEHGGAR